MKLTYILPIIEYKKEYLEKCLRSLKWENDEKLIIVGPGEVLKKLEEVIENYKDKTILVTNPNKTDFCSQINLGVEHVKSEYFSIVEFDDTYTERWVEHVYKHISCMNNVSLFLPIIVQVDDKDGNVKSLGNELSWSTAFVENLGYIDGECLESFYDFFIVGGVFKTKDFVEIGGLKPSLKIASSYELLLRMAHNGLKIYTIPKIGYRHTFNRDGSYSSLISKDITQEEGAWLIKTAKEEKFFKEDRNKIFTKE